MTWSLGHLLLGASLPLWLGAGGCFEDPVEPEPELQPVDPGAEFRPGQGPDGGTPVDGGGFFDAGPPGFGFDAGIDMSEVERPDSPPPPISGGGLVAADGRLMAADPDRDQVYLVDVESLDARTVVLDPGDEPGRVALGAERAYVALRGAGQVAVIDLADASVVRRDGVCALPRGLALAGDALHVACAGGELVTLATADGSERRRLRVAPDLRDVALDDQGLVVSRYRSAELMQLDASGAVKSRATPPPADFDFEFTGGGTFTPTLAWRTRMADDGSAWMVHQRASTGTIEIEQGGYGAGGCGSGIVQGTVTRFVDGAPEEQPGAILPGAVLPVDLAISPGGAFVAVVAAGNYYPTSFSPQLYLLSAPAEPTMGDCAEGAFQFGTESLEGEATGVTFVDEDTLALFVRDPARIHLLEIEDDFASLDREVTLAEDSVRSTGHHLFHQDLGGGIACASCHGEATDDGHVWTFSGIGPRRTQTLRGGIRGTEPFHWDGDMKDFDMLVREVLVGRMSGVRPTQPWSDALADWIDVQPALRPAVRDAEAVARGRALFESNQVGCTNCHNGEALTNNGSFDVGTGSVLQVPSLRGLGLRLPIMHDGCAQSFEERFDADCGGGDQHGVTSHLDEDQIADLVSYMKSL